MTVLAMIHPTDLLAKELRDTLDRRRELWTELRLLTTDDGEVGTVTEVRGAAAVIQHLDIGDLEDADVVIFCGPMALNRPVVEALAGSATELILSDDAAQDEGDPVVAGINLEHAVRGHRLRSPHPATIALAYLLGPLLPWRPRRAVATLLQPASMRGQEALDEVLDQTRRILRFEGQREPRVFAAQLAFNVLPTEAPTHIVSGDLKTLLGSEFQVTLHALQAGVFHGLGVGLYVELAEGPEPEEVRTSLAEHPFVELADPVEELGPIAAAAQDSLLLGAVDKAPGVAGGYWIWATMDNLTCGGANNALYILEAVTSVVEH